MKNKTCIVLWSKGMDSTVCLWVASKKFKDVIALKIFYGQKCREEMRPWGTALPKNVKVKDIDYNLNFCNSSLVRSSEDVKRSRELSSKIPRTFMPCRNLIFLTLAAAYGYPDIVDIFIGTNTIDYSGYSDCRSNFLYHAENTISLALDKKVKIHRPLQQLSKADIIKWGIDLGVDFANTVSCYNPSFGVPCFIPPLKVSSKMSLEELQKDPVGCESCVIRCKAFNKLKMVDPLLTRLRKEGLI